MVSWEDLLETCWENGTCDRESKECTDEKGLCVCASWLLCSSLGVESWEDLLETCYENETENDREQ